MRPAPVPVRRTRPDPPPLSASPNGLQPAVAVLRQQRLHPRDADFRSLTDVGGGQAVELYTKAIEADPQAGAENLGALYSNRSACYAGSAPGSAARRTLTRRPLQYARGVPTEAGRAVQARAVAGGARGCD